MSHLGEALRSVREHGLYVSPLQVRELARQSGVSHTQIGRIESGAVQNPPDILVALARAMGRRPRSLLILAGHLSGDDARAELALMFREGAELEDWGEWAHFTIEEARSVVRHPDASEEQIRLLAHDVFLSYAQALHRLEGPRVPGDRGNDAT